MAEINKPTRLNQIWAEDGTAVPPSDSKYRQGWIVEAPPYQTENYINQKHDTFIAHTNQHGLPQWDNETEYQAGKSWTLGSNGSLYFCKATNTGQNPVTDLSETYWRKVLDGTNVLPATSVSSFALTLLDDTSAGQMRTTLGGTTIGQNLFTSVSAAVARGTLGATVVGTGLFTAANIDAARTALGISDLGKTLLDSNSPSTWRTNLGTNDASNLTTGTISPSRLPPSSETQRGGVQEATQAQVNAGTNANIYVQPSKMRLGVTIVASSNGGIALPSWLGGITFNWGSSSIFRDSNAPVTWAVPYTGGSCWQFFGNFGTGGNDQNSGLFFTDLSTTGGRIYHNGSSGSRVIRWWSVGNRG